MTRPALVRARSRRLDRRVVVSALGPVVIDDPLLELVDLRIRGLLDPHHPVIGLGERPDELVQLQLGRLLGPPLRVLDDEHHDHGDAGADRAERELQVVVEPAPHVDHPDGQHREGDEDRGAGPRRQRVERGEEAAGPRAVGYLDVGLPGALHPATIPANRTVPTDSVWRGGIAGMVRAMADNPVNLVRLCVDANDVWLVARFWAELLDYQIREIDDAESTGWLHLESDSPTLPKLTIQPVPETKGVKNRLHLDIFVTDPHPWIDRCVELGGRLLWRSEEPDDWFQVIADPEGNELCICRS